MSDYKMLTAEEARALNPKNAAIEYIKQLEVRIKDAALNGHSSIRVPYDMTEYKNGSAKFPSPIHEIVDKTLKNNGYKIEYAYVEKQFVDSYIVISW